MKNIKLDTIMFFLLAFLLAGCSVNPVLSSGSWEDSQYVVKGEYLDVTEMTQIVPDDGNSDSDGLQKAMEIAVENNQTLYLPAGNNTIDSSMIPIDGLKIKGDESGGTYISTTHDKQMPLFSYPDIKGLLVEDVVFDNVIFYFSTGDSENSGLKTVEDITFRRCLFISDKESYDSFIFSFQYGATNLLLEDSVMLFNPVDGSKGNRGFNLNGSENVIIQNNVFGLDLTDDVDLDYAEAIGTDGLNTVLDKVRGLRDSGRLSGKMNKINELIRLWNKEGDISSMKEFLNNLTFGEIGISGSWMYYRSQLNAKVSGNRYQGFSKFLDIKSGPYAGLTESDNNLIP